MYPYIGDGMICEQHEIDINRSNVSDSNVNHYCYRNVKPNSLSLPADPVGKNLSQWHWCTGQWKNFNYRCKTSNTIMT